jgi:FKBP-type peptidyl-prolyl cis-trans isomerase
MKENKMNMIISAVIFIAVIAVLVFITINKKEAPAASQTVGVEQENMPNTQQIKGVKITITKEGTGDVAKSGDTVAMNYTGTLADGTVFDSNVNSKFGHVQPFIFTIGAGQVIKGWDVGVAGMKIGEKRTLVISPESAYGATGAGGIIPPNATISFDVELLQIKK